MKHFISIVICILCCSIFNMYAQNYEQNGKTFVQTKSVRASEDVKTDYTWKDSKSNEYPIFLHKITKGEREGIWVCYVEKTSQKTGKPYKYYIPNGEDIADKIRGEMNLK